jgi:CheY-like chemotaxis protein
MPPVRLIHWKVEEGERRAETLRAAGYEVLFDDSVGPELLRGLKEKPPAALVIDLTRLPSHGREVGVAMRQTKSTRHVPLVFAGGAPEKVARIRELLPDAGYTEWTGIRSALKRAISHPPAQPVATRSVFEAYRSRPLLEKLGIRANMVAGVAHAPKGFGELLGALPEGARLLTRPRQGCDLLIWFVRTEDELRRDLCRMAALADDRPIWIAWRKKSAGGNAGLNQQIVRKSGLAAGLVDYKICAIDATWAGLLFRKRK